jgi:hypothetical protein
MGWSPQHMQHLLASVPCFKSIQSEMFRDMGKKPLLEGSDGEADSVNSSVAPSPQGVLYKSPVTASGSFASPSAPWRLVITGHSLGAGIAAFAGLFLHTMYPGVRVFCYSTPAWLMTPDLAEYTEKFVTSVIINKDLFSRCIFLPHCKFHKAFCPE